jgi:hypothetical protein
MKNKIAICFSGDLRTFDICVDNIISNIIKPLKEDFDVDIFISTWKNGNNSIDNFKNKLSPVIIDEEDRKDEYFITNYSTDNYKKDRLMCPSTPYNSASMWYKVLKTKELYTEYSKNNNFEYSCVFRLRPDIIYTQKLDTKLVYEAINNNCLYMSNSERPYQSVTFNLLDTFVFGRLEAMNIFNETFLHIKQFNLNNIVCSIEGYLNEQIKNVELKRFDFSHSIQRHDRLDNLC